LSDSRETSGRDPGSGIRDPKDAAGRDSGFGVRDSKIDDLIAAARAVREHARADYSGFKVGAALETTDGTIVTGCNIENATYGLTVCAERVAMFKALSEGHREFRRMVVVAPPEAPTPPCGACRQVLWEFAGDLELILANAKGETGRHRMSELLPQPFDARLLK
jgi:cytidine deaminase